MLQENEWIDIRFTFNVLDWKVLVESFIFIFVSEFVYLQLVDISPSNSFHQKPFKYINMNIY